jgi:hypothetical protein
MRTIAALALALALLALPAAAATLQGYLISSEQFTTVTGEVAWECTYDVNGQRVTIMRGTPCPYYMNFR